MFGIGWGGCHDSFCQLVTDHLGENSNSLKFESDQKMHFELNSIERAGKGSMQTTNYYTRAAFESNTLGIHPRPDLSCHAWINGMVFPKMHPFQCTHSFRLQHFLSLLFPFSLGKL